MRISKRWDPANQSLVFSPILDPTTHPLGKLPKITGDPYGLRCNAHSDKLLILAVLPSKAAIKKLHGVSCGCLSVLNCRAVCVLADSALNSEVAQDAQIIP